MDNAKQVTVYPQYKNFLLLKPGHFPARSGETFQQFVTESDIPTVVELAKASRILAVDFETCGNDYSRFPTDHVVGIGLAWDSGSVYLDWTSLSPAGHQQLLSLLLTHTGLIAHNIYFDGGWVFQMTGQHPQWNTCTFGLYKQLATEGFIGQTWGLKDAMVDLLGWTDTNEADLDQWLVENGYHKQNKAPDKSQMWRAPAHILGKYCVLDAEATYLLLTEILEPVEKRFPNLGYYHRVDFMHLVKVLIEQKIHGILVDRDKLAAHNSYLVSEIERLQVEFIRNPEIAPHIAEYEQAKLKEFTETEPERYKKFNLPPEPAKQTKTGAPSKTWIGWKAKKDKGPEVSKTWLNWQERYKAILRGENPDYRFNLRSGQQLRWLFFDKLGLPPAKETESGLPSVDGQALGTYKKPYLEPFLKAADLIKEQSYIQDYLDLTTDRSTIHPSFRTPGTLTGRLSSNSPNVQQMPKTKAIMSCFIPRPGHVFVDLDFAALEPHVTAELSKCPKMNLLYGPGRPDNDVYMFVGAHIKGLKENILAAGYDPVRPSKEGLSKAKKEAKRERSICKVIHLSAGYGAGAGKMQATLGMSGIDMAHHQVEEILTMYWDLFSAVKEYGFKLRKEYKKNRGWVVNGMGRPLAVDELMSKDLLNRVVQSTGHDILILYVRLVTEELTRRGIPWKPSIVDWHDSCMVEVPEEYAKDTAEVLEQAVNEVNNILDWNIKHKGSAEIGHNLADVKQPEH
jgi:DNA polymerase I-like protein with 3'-5' exonuclease and polymerase domains